MQYMAGFLIGKQYDTISVVSVLKNAPLALSSSLDYILQTLANDANLDKTEHRPEKKSVQTISESLSSPSSLLIRRYT